MANILIVDDDELISSAITEALSDDDTSYHIKVNNTGNNVIEQIKDNTINLVLLDVYMGDVNGIDILKLITEQCPDINVIMISGEADIETAISAVKIGAFDFMQKPLSLNRLKVIVRNALNASKQKIENIGFREQMLSNYTFGGNSAVIQKVEKTIEKAAPSNIPVLITGENGTGKEIVARRLHYKSTRASQPFIAVNCASIPSELLESELFGHKKGSFTGATQNKDGYFIRAKGGTLFLDEIGDMPFDLQAKILRALQEKEVIRVGESDPIKIDVRIISATNKQVETLINEGTFREDLFYRLNGLNITIPPLHERIEDIPALAHKFIAEFCYENNRTVPEIKESAYSSLQQYQYPGNVRELKNIIHRTILLNEGESITEFHIPDKSNITQNEIGIHSLGTLQEVKHSLLETYLKNRLQALEGNKKILANELGIHVNNLYRILRDANVAE